MEIGKLGDGNVFIKRTETGGIKAIYGEVLLEELKNEIAFVKGKFMITAPGYNKLNRIAGISIFTPDKLFLPDGKEVCNPYPIIDEKSNTISKIWGKKIAVGYSPIGNLSLVSSTIIYDVNLYFIKDLMEKMVENKRVGKVCKENMLTEEDKSKGIFLPVEGDMGVWTDLQDKEALECFSRFTENKLFCERKVQTIAERNCLKKHPALSFVEVTVTGQEGNHIAMVPVVGWSNDLTQKDLEKIASIKDNEQIIYNDKNVEILKEDNIDESDIKLSDNNISSEIITPIQLDTIKAEKTLVKENEKANEKQELLKNISAERKRLGDNVINQIISKIYRKNLETELTNAQLKMLRKMLINEGK